MTAISTVGFRINSAEQLLESVSEPASTMLYVCYGKSTPWANDSLPNTTIDSLANTNEIWRNLIAGKKVTGNDVTLVSKRFTWTSGTTYDQYDDTSSILYDGNTKFYVITSNYNVYKCLYNNNGANSTIEPTYTSPGTTSTEADGYIWKYMYTLNTKEIQRFLSYDWIPVKTLTLDNGSAQWQVQQAAIDGAIDVILVSNTGTGYTNSSNITVTITGDGTGANATAYVNTTSNVVANIVVTSRGTGYTFASATISGGGGTGANARVVIGPYGGHGYNPSYELGAKNVMIDTLIQGSEDNELVTSNDFRQISVIKDPIIYGSSNVFSNSIFTQTLSLALAGPSEYVTDEFVYQGSSIGTASFKGRVLYWDSANSIMEVTEYTGNPTTTTLNGSTSGGYRYITSVINPTLKSRSGQVIYMDNMIPITRAVDQTENIKIVIKF